MRHWIFTFAILIVSIPSIITLRCYVCNSIQNADCANYGSLSAYTVDCNITVAPYCRKLDQTVDKQKSTVRTCGSKIRSKACYSTVGTNSANVCSCNSDLCNNAISFNRQQQQVMTTIVLTITMILLR